MVMIKVLHVNATTEGGASGAAQKLHLALVESGEIQSKHYIFSGRNLSQKNTYVANTSFIRRLYAFFLHGIDKLSFLRYERDKSIRFQFSHAAVGVDITKHPLFIEADIIHLHWVHKGFQSMSSIKKIIESQKKLVWTMHDMWLVTGGCYHVWGCDNYHLNCGDCPYLRTPDKGDLSFQLFNVKKKLWKRGQIHIVAPSEWIKIQAEKSGLASSVASFTEIPNLIDTDKFKPMKAEEKLAFSNAIGLKKNCFTLLFASAYLPNPQKGFDRFIKLYNTIKERHDNIQALIIGDAKDTFYDIQDSVFLGYISSWETMVKAYSVSDLYAITSLQDNLPGTVLESMSCGTPAAGFNIGGIPEMIDNDVNGFIGESESIDELADRIVQYIGNTEMHLEFAQRSREKILDKYLKSVIASKHESLYRELMKYPE